MLTVVPCLLTARVGICKGYIENLCLGSISGNAHRKERKATVTLSPKETYELHHCYGFEDYYAQHSSIAIK